MNDQAARAFHYRNDFSPTIRQGAMIASFAIAEAHFAIAIESVAVHKKRAFQASSPKNFRAGR
ncbi:hypothetical protein [uncultured Sphingomonas sp.]|uniref:hypothetical protein n=1 Tax=uncultured Sphingomonas sp. TaxID=158754 RepID=UPI0035C9D664